LSKKEKRKKKGEEGQLNTHATTIIFVNVVIVVKEDERTSVQTHA
jgi:hypothetical protein